MSIKSLTIMFALLFTSFLANAAPKYYEIDLRNRSENSSYYIVFYVDSPDKQGSIDIGHAFTGFYRDSWRDQMSITDGTWGFYGTGNDVKIFGTMPSAIVDDAQRNFDKALIARVNSDVYWKAYNVKNEYNDARYQLALRNCVSYTDDVAEITGLDTPRGWLNTPAAYFRKLIDVNF